MHTKHYDEFDVRHTRSVSSQQRGSSISRNMGRRLLSVMHVQSGARRVDTKDIWMEIES